MPLNPTPSRRTLLGAAGAAVAASLAAPLLRGHGAGAGGDSAVRQPLDEREIPGTGEKIPAVGLGTWQQFDIDLSDEQAAGQRRAVLERFHEAGGRVIDSSPMYGRSEEVVGRLSTDAGLNESFFIATKVWTRGREAGEQQMRQSMQRLGREKLELMQVHNLLDVEEHLRTLQAWKEAGTFRYIGVTHYTARSLPELERYATGRGVPKVDFIQLPYNIQMRDAEERLLPACRDNGVATLINIPFGSGGLIRSVADRPLPEHARRYAGSWAQALLKFILANEAVTCVIPGTSNPRHVVDNCGAMTGPLPTAEERRRLIEAVEA